MRYWFAEESLGATLVLNSAYVGVGYSNKGKVSAVKSVASSSGTGADHYLEFSFEATLAAKGDKDTNDQFTVNVTVHNSGYTGKVDLTNDYSYNDGVVGYNEKITLHSGGKVIWGTLPSGGGPIIGNPDAGFVVPSPDASTIPDVSAIYTVTFNAGVGKGAMSGYGWVIMGALDVVTSPTCGPNEAAITARDTCVSTSTNWESNTAVCVSGTIPALPPSPTSTDLADNWGSNWESTPATRSAPSPRTTARSLSTSRACPEPEFVRRSTARVTRSGPTTARS
jgi:hypothetical protein